jgi:hypothetical protein
VIGRRFLAWWAGLLATLGGCSALLMGGVGCMGARMPPQHPTVALRQAQVTPAGTVNSGQTLQVTADTTKFSKDCIVEFIASVSPPPVTWLDQPQSNPDADDIMVQLRDDGKNGDQSAHDGLWYGECQVAAHQDCTMHTGVRVTFNRANGQPDYMPQTQDLADLIVDVTPASAAGSVK